MTNVDILSIVTFIYFGSFLLYLLAMVMGNERLGRAAGPLALAGIIGHTSGIIYRWAESYSLGIGHAPFSNLFESLIFFAWTIVFIYLLMERRTKNRSLGVFATLLAFLAMAYASYSPSISSHIQPLVPALKSNWLIAHVVTCFFGYAAFAVAFGLSLAYLLKGMERPERRISFLDLVPETATLDEMNYQMVATGFVLLTIGIVTGSIWAHSAWGRYWGWDPKETWSLITWLVYAALLHSHAVKGWRGKRLAVLSILGFSCVLFTYLGVNYLAGLHSYAKS